MFGISSKKNIDLWLLVPIIFLSVLSIFTLKAISPNIFPVYYFYLGLGLLAFFLFSRFEFSVHLVFSNYLYIFSILLLIITLIIGRVTRGVIRWIPIGDFTFQPSEIIRPFLIVFFAKLISEKRLDLKSILKIVILIFLPLFLIFIQPSLGVAVLTLVGIIGVIIPSGVNKKIFIGVILLFLLSTPIIYKILAPYQKTRIESFFAPQKDPQGAGYNSIQSMISVGSGKLFGRGLGKGVQTQLLFLPERQTDFVFAAISEELGLLGASLTLLALFTLVYRLTMYLDKFLPMTSRLYITGVFFVLTLQIVVNIAMNLGIFPIAGLPLPLVSAGGSSYLATMISLGIANSAWKS